MDGASVDFGVKLVGANSSRAFTIRNAGPGDLTGLGITFDGPAAADFAVTASPVAPVPAPDGSTTLTVTFAPVAPGAKSAVLHLACNDADENPFDIALTGRALDPNADDDGDRVTNAGEVNMAALGFDLLVDNTPLRTLLHDNALTMGLYRASDVQSLALSWPLLQKNPLTGRFQLRIGVETSPALSNWTPLTGFTPTFDAPTGLITLDIPPAATSAQFFRVLPFYP